MTPDERRAAIIAAVMAGRSAASVGVDFGISRQRVAAILKKYTGHGVPTYGTRCRCGGRNRRDDMHTRSAEHVAFIEARREDRRAAAVQRFWSHAEPTDVPSAFRPDLGPCWLWTGPTTEVRPGWLYGNSGIRHERFAHRAAYVLTVGAIPAGWQIDHLCRITTCVNPVHLEAVTPAENVRRGKNKALRHLRAVPARRTHCLRGHERTPENLSASGNCRACAHERYLARRRRSAA